MLENICITYKFSNPELGAFILSVSEVENEKKNNRTASKVAWELVCGENNFDFQASRSSEWAINYRFILLICPGRRANHVKKGLVKAKGLSTLIVEVEGIETIYTTEDKVTHEHAGNFFKVMDGDPTYETEMKEKKDIVYFLLLLIDEFGSLTIGVQCWLFFKAFQRSRYYNGDFYEGFKDLLLTRAREYKQELKNFASWILGTDYDFNTFVNEISFLPLPKELWKMVYDYNISPSLDSINSDILSLIKQNY